jgi:hypothetical protein
MKTLLQAKPQLRGPKGLHSWYAQLPVANVAADEPAGSLPIGRLLWSASHTVAAESKASRTALFSAQLLTALFGLLSKKLHYGYADASPRPAAGPWLRHLLG